MINLKEIRKKKGYSQKELAERLGIADCTLAHYESGIRKITLEMFLNVLDVCELDMKLVEKSYFETNSDCWQSKCQSVKKSK